MNPYDIFIAEAAAEATVDNLYRRAENPGITEGNAAGVTAVVSVLAVLSVGLWVSPLGRKVRKRVAEAITPKN